MKLRVSSLATAQLLKTFRCDDAPEASLAGGSETVTSTQEALASNVANMDMQAAIESENCVIGRFFVFHLTHLYTKSLIEPVKFNSILL